MFRVVLLAAVAAVGVSNSCHAAGSDIIAQLGEPRRNVEFQRVRPVEEVAQQAARNYPSETAFLPVMIWPSKGAMVEAVFNPVSRAKCRSVLSSYNAYLRSKYTAKEAPNALYCVSIAGGQVKSIETIAKNY